MSDNEMTEQEEIYSKVLRAGRRTYFFDVRATKAGDYYLTITESKKFTNDDGSFHYKKHKIYLYKEDLNASKEHLDVMMKFVVNEKGEEIISERHQKDIKRASSSDAETDTESLDNETPRRSHSFTIINFEDI